MFCQNPKLCGKVVCARVVERVSECGREKLQNNVLILYYCIMKCNGPYI